MNICPNVASGLSVHLFHLRELLPQHASRDPSALSSDSHQPGKRSTWRGTWRFLNASATATAAFFREKLPVHKVFQGQPKRLCQKRGFLQTNLQTRPQSVLKWIAGQGHFLLVQSRSHARAPGPSWMLQAGIN